MNSIKLTSNLPINAKYIEKNDETKPKYVTNVATLYTPKNIRTSYIFPTNKYTPAVTATIIS